MRIAAIDLGTVSSRLLLAEVENGTIVSSSKQTVITDLGEGVDATGRLAEAAIRRVLDACDGFSEKIAAYGPVRMCTTLTSAARDASNGEELIDALERRGLRPHVISGETEAKLTFYGVAHDFPGERLVVADSGGGSTEFAVGTYMPGERLEVERTISLNIGCRRVTERFLADGSAAADQESAASAWIAPQFKAWWDELGEPVEPKVSSGFAARPESAVSFESVARPGRLVAVGGTVTTLVAMTKRLAAYDSSLVHLSELSLRDVEDCLALMEGLSTEEIAQLPGIQPKRAPVIRGGALVIRELMRTGGYDALTVSENSLLAGMAATLFEAASGQTPAISE